MKDKLGISVGIIGAIILGFLIGQLKLSPEVVEIVEKEIRPEVSLIQLKEIKGDMLELEISGPARIIWADDMVENDGFFQIPLSQISTENDRKYTEFPFTGNEKTKKFYPSDTYFARGVEVRYRRFFLTKEEAINAGFIPSKGVN
ncbi:hypothetical protein K9M41_03620 [Candidatus Gracilibacteria bacterium]|nr:hypothetical protein [Candidatus Gracilibacteria bacterium]